MFIDETVTLEDQSISEFIIEKLLEFKHFKPSYWMTGNIDTGLIEIKLFGYTTTFLPQAKIKQVFNVEDDDYQLDKIFFSGVVCLHQSSTFQTPFSTSLVIDKEEGKTFVVGSFIVGGAYLSELIDSTIGGMNTAMLIEALQKITFNPFFREIRVMFP
jgi:hypothetical protein